VLGCWYDFRLFGNRIADSSHLLLCVNTKEESEGEKRQWLLQASPTRLPLSTRTRTPRGGLISGGLLAQASTYPRAGGGIESIVEGLCEIQSAHIGQGLQCYRGGWLTSESW
jgi:hypothetical protein